MKQFASTSFLVTIIFIAIVLIGSPTCYASEPEIKNCSDLYKYNEKQLAGIITFIAQACYHYTLSADESFAYAHDFKQQEFRTSKEMGDYLTELLNRIQPLHD